MAQEVVNLGSAVGANDGDPSRIAFGKVNDNFADLYSSTSSLSTQVGSVTTQVATLTSQYSALNGQYGSLSATVSGFSSTLGTQGSAISTLTTQYGAVSSGLSGLTTIVNSQGTKIQALQGLQPEIDSVQGQITVLNTQVSTLQTQVQSLSAQASGVAKALPAEVARAQAAEAALQTSQDAAVAALTTRLAASEQAVAALQALVGTKFDNLASIVTQSLLGDSTKVGASPLYFGSRVDGAPADIPQLSSDRVVTTAQGLVWEALGAGVVSTRTAVTNSVDRFSVARFSYARQVAASDPTQALIRCGIACLNQNYAIIGVVVVNDDVSTVPDVAPRHYTTTVADPHGVVDGTMLLPGTVYWRPFISVHGTDGRVDVLTLASRDVTDANMYTPDLTRVLSTIDGIQQAVAALNPLVAGQANGLATLDSQGTVAQLPVLKSDFFLALQAVAPGALEVVNTAVANSGDETLVIRNRSPFVSAGDPWLAFAAAVVGLTVPQAAAMVTGLASRRVNQDGRPAPVVAPIMTSAVLRAARNLFGPIDQASIKGFVASQVGDPDSNDNSYYAYYVDPTAPVGGQLYGMLLAYLRSSDGPGLSAQATLALLTQIWTTASPLPF